MGELITTLGIDGKLLIAQLINFLILYLVLRKFLFTPLLTMLDKRREMAEANVKEKEKLDNLGAKTDAEREELLLEARKESGRIVEEARERADQLSSNRRKEAEKDAQELSKKNEAQLISRKKEFDRELKQEAANLIGRSLRKIVPQMLDEKIDEKIIQSALEDIKSSDK